ncbi:YbaB/EbfC family nucleoid-associated protein, partial [Pelagibacteraceae bacterium]|nr:YbaB/EbfC family nucleoid-associated protein [Pelagibacteraceae bacterium]
GDLVKVILTGDYEMKSIYISDEAKKEDQEIVNDLIKAAYNNAKDNLKKKSAEELSKITGGMSIPLDFKLPF